MIYNTFNKKDTQQITRWFYDIEVLPHDFTVVFMSVDDNKQMQDTFVFAINDDDDEHSALKEELTQIEYRNHTVPIEMISSGQSNLGTKLKTCMDMFTQMTPPSYYVNEFYGWNSDNYDLPIMCFLYAYSEVTNTYPSPQILRFISDLIIESEHRTVYSLSQALTQVDFKDIPIHEICGLMVNVYQRCIESMNHIDIGAINEKSKDIKSGAQFMFPLKTIASYCGLDIVEDETTRLDFSQFTRDDYTLYSPLLYENAHTTVEGIKEVIYYNINDVYVTGQIYFEKEYGQTLEIKDTLRRKFSFLLPQERKVVLPRSATMAQISGKIIRGENQNVLVDDPVVDLTYPFEDGTKRNLLDYVAEHEHVHPLMIDFYRQFDGHDMHSREAHYATLAQSITAKDGSSGTTCNIPYMDKNGKALNTYITLSIGGAHGGVIDNFKSIDKQRVYDSVEGHDMNDKQFIEDFAFAKIGQKNTHTIDVENVIHADFASYYPSMNILFGVYRTKEGVDNYKQVRDDRIKVKDSIPSDLSTWTEEDYKNENIQLGMKLVINAATGASNQHKDNVDLPLDNKTTRMRITGNILIYVLGQRFADEGGFVFSTNTDGLYLTGVSKERAKEICDDFMATYGLSIEPEPLARMINKSANERIEYEHPTLPNRVGGNLGRSTGKRIPLDSNIDYPRACGKAVLDYMSNRRDWLTGDDSEAYIRQSLEKQLEDFIPIDWTITLKGNRNRQFSLEDGTSLLNTNRVVMSKDGQNISMTYKGKQNKIPKMTSTIVEILNSEKSLKEYDYSRLNIDAYVEWSLQLLAKWL